MKLFNSALLLLFIGSVMLLSGCTCPENQPGADEFSFVFMTDIHITPNRQAPEGFKKVMDTVNQMKPDFVITGGDLIMDALEQKYSRADSLYNMYISMVKEFQMPVYNTMGNHEIYGWYENSGADTNHPEYGKKMFENRIGKRFQSFNHKGWKIFILDSVIKDGKGGYMGGITEDQMVWIKEELAMTDTTMPLVISVHIPFITTESQILNGATAANHPAEVITNSKEILDLFKGHNLKLVLQGHLHYYEELYVFGTRFITGGAVSGAWWKGPYLETEEGFLKVNINGDDFTWEYVDYAWL